MDLCYFRHRCRHIMEWQSIMTPKQWLFQTPDSIGLVEGPQVPIPWIGRFPKKKLQSYSINFKDYVLIMMVPFSPFKQFLSLPYDMLHRHAHTQSEEALVFIKMIPTYWETDISYIRQDTNQNSQIGIEENQQWEIIVPFFPECSILWRPNITLDCFANNFELKLPSHHYKDCIESAFPCRLS